MLKKGENTHKTILILAATVVIVFDSRKLNAIKKGLEENSYPWKAAKF